MRLIFILLFPVFIISSCATMKKDCPPQNIVTVVEIGNYAFPLTIKKGFLNPTGEGTDWITEKKYNELYGIEEEKPETECCPEGKSKK